MTIKKGYIYKVTNNQNEMVFIGYNSSIPLNQVISRDKSNIKNAVYKEKKLYAAMRELGFINFTYEIVMEIDVSNSNSELLKWYRIVKKEYDSIDNGYNEIRGNYQGKYGDVHKKKINTTESKPTFNEWLDEWVTQNIQAAN